MREGTSHSFGLLPPGILFISSSKSSQRSFYESGYGEHDLVGDTEFFLPDLCSLVAECAELKVVCMITGELDLRDFGLRIGCD